MDNYLWKWVWRIGFMVCTIAAILAIFANADKAPRIILYCLIGVSIICGLIGLILDFKPWKWRVWKKRFDFNIPAVKIYRDASGKPICPKNETFGELARDWKEHTKGEWYFRRERLNVFSEWPMIQELSCQFFGHSAWTNDTYNRLVSWLLTTHVAGNRDEMMAMPRSEVVRLLQEAVNEKPRG